jgi:hypothetical protein
MINAYHHTHVNLRLNETLGLRDYTLVFIEIRQLPPLALPPRWMMMTGFASMMSTQTTIQMTATSGRSPEYVPMYSITIHNGHHHLTLSTNLHKNHTPNRSLSLLL